MYTGVFNVLCWLCIGYLMFCVSYGIYARERPAVSSISFIICSSFVRIRSNINGSLLFSNFCDLLFIHAEIYNCPGHILAIL